MKTSLQMLSQLFIFHKSKNFTSDYEIRMPPTVTPPDRPRPDQRGTSRKRYKDFKTNSKSRPVRPLYRPSQPRPKACQPVPRSRSGTRLKFLKINAAENKNKRVNGYP
ncbi:hypothetical protein YC2023_045150 [Brassica napus]